jgi:hypothetical protein
LPTSAYDAFDYNLCYYPNASGAAWSSQYSTLSAWQSNTGFDLNSWNADPGFNDPTAGDFTAVSNSATIVDNGHPSLSSPLEIGGGFRDAAPDIGAHEWELWLPTEFIHLPVIIR